MENRRTHYRTCSLCEAMCGIEIQLEDERIVDIRGDRRDPFSRGHVCPKAVALKDLHEDPDRLRRPMERTESGWREIGWEQALDRVAAELRRVQGEHGNDAVGVYLGNPNVHNTGSMLMGRHLLRALKTRNKYSATSVDQLPHHIVAHRLFGHQLRIPVPDIDRTDMLLIFGGNPLASNGSIMTAPDIRNRLKDIRKRGGRVVVVDPRRTETAELAGEHHFIRPGADALALLAMLHVLFEEDLMRPGKLADYVDGLDTLAERVAPYPPERVAPHTGMGADELRQLARDFAGAERAACYGRIGVSVQPFGTLCQYLITLLNILTGRLDAEGGPMFTTPAVDIAAQTGPGHYGRSHSRVRGLPEFNGEYPVATLAEEILTPGDGRIRAMVTVAGNPVLSTPNGEQLDRAFEGLDFMVAIDPYLNETTRHADIILPPVSPLEREHYDVIFHLLAVRNTSRYAPPLFEPPAEARDDWQIFLDLRDRLQPLQGVAALKRRLTRRLMTPSRTLDLLLRSGPHGSGFKPFGRGLTLAKLRDNPHGIDLGPLQPDRLPAVLGHPDRRIHLESDFFFADLDRVEETFFGEPARDREAFLLIGRRHVRSNNSWMHNSQRLVKGKPRCTALIHPADAERLGIADGARVQVSSRVGSVDIAAEITDAIMPGVVSIPHGWGHHRSGIRMAVARKHAGVSINDLTDEQAVDALSGNAALNAVPVRVEAMGA